MSESNGYVSRELFLKPAPRRHIDLVLPVSGYKVRLQSLTELEKSKYENASWDNKGNRLTKRITDSKARLIVLCVVDSEGRRLLTDDDMDSVLAMDSRDTSHLFDVLWEHVGFSRSDAEQLAKN